MADIRGLLSVKISSPYWDEATEKAKKDPKIPEWLTEEYISALQKDYNIFPQNYNHIISAIPHIVRVPELCMLAKILYHIVGMRFLPDEAFPEFELPKVCDGSENAMAYEMFSIFPVIAHIRDAWKEYAERGIGDDIIAETFRHGVDELLSYRIEQDGRPRYTEREFLLYRGCTYNAQLIIGRLRYEIHQNSNRPAYLFRNKDGEIRILMANQRIHKSGYILGSGIFKDEEGSYDPDFFENESFYEGYEVNEKTRLANDYRTRLEKSVWTPVFIPGDSVIKVHIPWGKRLDDKACKESLERAEKLYKRCFPEIDFKGFVCCCWMLSPELRDVLKKDSNIILFQDRFNVFPAMNTALDVYLYVFGMDVSSIDEIDFEKLPEENSLMRGVKRKALEGKYVHQFNGFIPWK